MNIFTKAKTNFNSTSNNAIIAVYMFSVLIAANIIVPIEDSFITGILKSLVWPLYIVTKF